MLQEVEILLVEDNMADAELTMRALNKAKIANSILHLKDGAEALDYLFGKGDYSSRDVTKLPKVILLDIKMPKIDGIEVLRQLKTHEQTKVIPVVIMTSSSEEKDIVASYQLGVNSYVVKPVGFEDFAKAVGELGFYWMLLNKSINNL